MKELASLSTTCTPANGFKSESLQPKTGYDLVKRLFDVVFAVVTGAVLVFPMLLIAIAVKLTSRGPILHWSRRIGRRNTRFLMPKFRTMRVDTPQLATHLLHTPERYITPLGRWLRKTSLDELPQLYSILKGELSFVGPRPALFNQHDLVSLRATAGIDQLVPGLTGWAQVNGRDELSVLDKVRFEQEYLQRRSFTFDLRILAATFINAATGRGVSH